MLTTVLVSSPDNEFVLTEEEEEEGVEVFFESLMILLVVVGAEFLADSGRVGAAVIAVMAEEVEEGMGVTTEGL